MCAFRKTVTYGVRIKSIAQCLLLKPFDYNLSNMADFKISEGFAL